MKSVQELNSLIRKSSRGRVVRVDARLTRCAVEIARDLTGRDWSDLLFVTDTKGGRMMPESSKPASEIRSVTVPVWAWDKGFEYFEYYIAHELSHVYQHMVAGRKKGVVHDTTFYHYFKSICREELQHYEAEYIKGAASFGVKVKPKFDITKDTPLDLIGKAVGTGRSLVNNVGKRFEHSGKQYQMVNWNSRAPKWPLEAIQLNNGKEYKFRINMFKDLVWED